MKIRMDVEGTAITATLVDNASSRPETKRHYQLGMAEQVRQAVEKTNKRLYGMRAPLHFRDSSPQKKEEGKIAVCK
jgi:hypothetical protein